MHPSHPSNNRRVDRRSYADLANPSGPPFHPDRRASGRGPGATNNKHHVPPMMNPRPPMNLNTRGPAEGRTRGGDDFRAMGGAPGMEPNRPPPSMHWESSNSGPRGERSLIPPMMMMRNLPPPSNLRRSRDTGSVSSEGEILSDSELTPPPPVRYSDPRGGADVMYAPTHHSGGGTYAASLSQEEVPPRRLPPRVNHPEPRWPARDVTPVHPPSQQRPPDVTSHFNHRNMDVPQRPPDVASHYNNRNMEVPQRPLDVASHYNNRNMEVPPPRPSDAHYNNRNMEIPHPRPPDMASHYNNRNMEVPHPRPPDVSSHYNNRNMEVPPPRPSEAHYNNRNMEVPPPRPSEAHYNNRNMEVPQRPPDLASHYSNRNMEVPPPRIHATHRPPDVHTPMDVPPPDPSFHIRDTEFSHPREPERQWLDRPPENHRMPLPERDRMPLERDRLPQQERDRMPPMDRDRMPLERDRLPQLERGRMPPLEPERMPPLERDRMPLERDRMLPERDRMPPERPERDRLPFRAVRGSRRGKGGRRWRNAEHRAPGPRNEMERRNVREESHYAPPPMVAAATPPLPAPHLRVEGGKEQEAEPRRMEEEPPVVIEELLPPPPAEPSALVAATIRAVDLEAQMEYEYAKFMRLTSQQQRLRAEYHVLERLAVGIPAFQADYDAYLASNPLVEVPLEPSSGTG